MLKYDRGAGLAKIHCDSCPASMESVGGRACLERAAMARAVNLAKLAR